MVKRKPAKCRYGRLKSPVRNPATGYIRRCKLKKKTHKGRVADRKHKSKEFHEVRHRRKSRAKRKTARRKKR